jgi:hypothetical protein
VAWGLAHISALELAEWEAYYHMEPFGEERADLRAGIVASTVANVQRDRKKKPQPFKPEDFMPKFNKPRKQTPAELREFARMMATAGYGRFTDGDVS